MTLNPEWLHRIKNWQRELPVHFYHPLGAVELSGFTTMEHLTVEQALQGKFRPMPAGTPWGRKFEYGWFQGSLTLPPEAAGQRIVLQVNVGQFRDGDGQANVFVNGRMAGARDREHTHITLAMQGEPGARYDLLVEGYAGHGATPVGEGPVAYGVPGVPEPPTPITVMGESTFGIWNEEVYQLWLDVETLMQVRDNLDPESLRVAEIDAGLRDFTLIADMELPFDEILETIRAARARLKPLLDCINGSTAPLLYVIGHAHMDIAWLWRLDETERKIAGTVASQLALAAEYPEYKYNQSQAHLLWMIKKWYPALYEEIKAAVKVGNIVPEGGMWVEADTNLSSGESLIRQFLYGKRFFREELGVECELLWLPDVFGYSGALPQVMQGCGVKYFATQKIFWTYNGADPFPYNTFTWEGIDGTEVLAHIFGDYNSQTYPAALIQRWRNRVQKDGISSFIVSFGWGDGGGGPTRDHLEFLRRCRDLEGVPRTLMTSPVEFFKDLERQGIPDARYVGELYFQAHRGTYTSQARTKKGNRKSEYATREAELWSVAARALKGVAYPRDKMEEVWRTILLHQFHDILPGSSIEAVYQEAEAAHARTVDAANGVARAAQASLAEEGKAATVFNSLSWERKALIPIPEGFGALCDTSGRALPLQRQTGAGWVEVTVPACGWNTVYPGPGFIPENTLRARGGNPGVAAQGEDTGEMTPPLLENELLRLEFNDKGEIASVTDKEIGRELAAGPCNSFKMYKDVPNWFDAWDIDSMAELAPVPLDAPATIEVLAQGPLFASLRVTRMLNRSPMTQVITLRRDSRRVDFATEIDWQERHKLLKVAFPVQIHANAAIHEIQFGHIRRPNHRSRPFDANRFEVSNHKWTALAEENRGCAVINDCKYGVNVLDHTIALTLLKSALAPDGHADQGHQAFTYAFYAWNGSFADSDVVREAYDLNIPVTIVQGGAGRMSLFSMDAPNVIVETVKPAEDRSGDVIVRLYEAKRMATRCRLTTALPVKGAAQTDMLENVISDLSCEDGVIALDFRPFEIKTVRLRM